MQAMAPEAIEEETHANLKARLIIFFLELAKIKWPNLIKLVLNQPGAGMRGFM